MSKPPDTTDIRFLRDFCDKWKDGPTEEVKKSALGMGEGIGRKLAQGSEVKDWRIESFAALLQLFFSWCPRSRDRSQG